VKRVKPSARVERQAKGQSENIDSTSTSNIMISPVVSGSFIFPGMTKAAIKKFVQ
jgi:hypothetical protein